jgi:hypothetical protein
MIDTNKYEGHTPAPWFPFDGTDSHGYGWEIRLPTHKHDADSINTTSVGSHHIDIGVRKKRLSETDAQLIADAPLLLEAFKHLRVIYEELYLDWRKVWDTLENMGMAKEMRQHFPNTFFDTMEMTE